MQELFLYFVDTNCVVVGGNFRRCRLDPECATSLSTRPHSLEQRNMSNQQGENMSRSCLPKARWRRSVTCATAFALFSVAAASAQDTYKIGMSAGLTGYAATVDRAWRDGVEIAIATLNARGGIMGRKIELVVEDNRSESQEAVTVYRKMITSDKVNVFDSGCVSAGNFAAAQFVVRAQIPMVLCSILPQQLDHVKWAFTTIPPPRFEIETRLEY